MSENHSKVFFDISIGGEYVSCRRGLGALYLSIPNYGAIDAGPARLLLLTTLHFCLYVAHFTLHR